MCRTDEDTLSSIKFVEIQLTILDLRFFEG